MQSIDKLLDISAAALDRKSNFVGKSTEKVGMISVVLEPSGTMIISACLGHVGMP